MVVLVLDAAALAPEASGLPRQHQRQQHDHYLPLVVIFAPSSLELYCTGFLVGGFVVVGSFVVVRGDCCCPLQRVLLHHRALREGGRGREEKKEEEEEGASGTSPEFVGSSYSQRGRRDEGTRVSLCCGGVYTLLKIGTACYYFVSCVGC